MPKSFPCFLPVMTVRMKPLSPQSDARRFYTSTHTRDVANLRSISTTTPHGDLAARLQHTHPSLAPWFHIRPTCDWSRLHPSQYLSNTGLRNISLTFIRLLLHITTRSRGLRANSSTNLSQLEEGVSNSTDCVNRVSSPPCRRQQRRPLNMLQSLL